MSATGDERPIEVRLRREIAAECRCGWGTALVAELRALRAALAEAEARAAPDPVDDDFPAEIFRELRRTLATLRAATGEEGRA